MSFGFSLGDFVTVPALAWQVYKSCKDSSDDFKTVADDVVALHIVLREVEEHLKEQPISSPRQAQLAPLTRTCQAVLNDLEKLLERYDSLGSQSQRTWDRMRWGLEDISQLRDRLSSSTTMLTAFNTSLICSSQARVEKKLNQLLREIREGKRESSFISIQSIESLTTEDKDAWKQMRRELEDFGISTSSFLQHRNFIVTWFRDAVAEGDFQSDSIDHPDGSTAHGSELTLEQPKLRARTHPADWIQHRRLSDPDLDECSIALTKNSGSGGDLQYVGSRGWQGSKLESGVAIETNQPQLSPARTTESFVVHRESINRASKSYPNFTRATISTNGIVQPPVDQELSPNVPTNDIESETVGTGSNKTTRRSFVGVARNSMSKAKRASKDITTRRSWKALFSSNGNDSVAATESITGAAVDPKYTDVYGSDLLHPMPVCGDQEKDELPSEESSLYHEHLYSISQTTSLTPEKESKARRRVTHDSLHKTVDFKTSSPASRMSFFTRPNSFPARNSAKKPVKPDPTNSSPAIEDVYAQNEAALSQLSQRIDDARREYARQVLKTGKKPVVDVSSTVIIQGFDVASMTRTPVKPVYTEKADQLHHNLVKQVKGTCSMKQGPDDSLVPLPPSLIPSSGVIHTPIANAYGAPALETLHLSKTTPHPTTSYLATKSSQSSLTSTNPPEPDHVFGSTKASWFFPTPPSRESFGPLQGSSGNGDAPLVGNRHDGERPRQTLVYM